MSWQAHGHRMGGGKWCVHGVGTQTCTCLHRSFGLVINTQRDTPPISMSPSSVCRRCWVLRTSGRPSGGAQARPSIFYTSHHRRRAAARRCDRRALRGSALAGCAQLPPHGGDRLHASDAHAASRHLPAVAQVRARRASWRRQLLVRPAATGAAWPPLFFETDN